MMCCMKLHRMNVCETPGRYACGNWIVETALSSASGLPLVRELLRFVHWQVPIVYFQAHAGHSRGIHSAAVFAPNAAWIP